LFKANQAAQESWKNEASDAATVGDTLGNFAGSLHNLQ
jgi:hypothetical protein